MAQARPPDDQGSHAPEECKRRDVGFSDAAPFVVVQARREEWALGPVDIAGETGPRADRGERHVKFALSMVATHRVWSRSRQCPDGCGRADIDTWDGKEHACARLEKK